MEKQDVEMTFDACNFFVAVQLLCDIRKQLGSVPEKQQLKNIVRKMDEIIDSGKL